MARKTSLGMRKILAKLLCARPGLSYQYDIDTENKERIFRQILSESRVSEENGNLYLDVPCQSLYPAVLQFSQAIAKVCSMSLYRREVISNLFYEMLDEF